MIYITDLLSTYDINTSALKDFAVTKDLKASDKEWLLDMWLDLEMARDCGGDANLIEACVEVSQGLEASIEFGNWDSYPGQYIGILTAIKDSLYHVQQSLYNGDVYC